MRLFVHLASVPAYGTLLLVAESCLRRLGDELSRPVRDLQLSGGEGGIRTPDRGVSPYNGLANRRLQPLGHLSVRFNKRVLNILALCPSVHLPDYCWTL